MKLTKLLRIVGVPALLVFLGLNAYGQMSSEFWIDLRDNDAPPGLVHNLFGNHINATYGIDSLNPTLKESEGPPMAPALDARWVEIPSRSASKTHGSGLLYFEFREYDNNPARLDTFKLKFQNLQNTGADIVVRWPVESYLRARCDSMWGVVQGGLPVINMLAVDSVVLPAAGDNGYLNITIYKKGCNIVDAVKQEKSTIPSGFALYQNYPNPFNPSTTIRFDIEKKATADIAVFNVLGQKIATLAYGELTPGTYSTTWSGINDAGRAVSSGIYIVRMIAKTAGVEQFSALQKVLLMK